MTATIIEFGARARASRPIEPEADQATADAKPVPAIEREGEVISVTARNQRLRNARREAWRKAEAITDYWCALLNFVRAAQRARDVGLREARVNTITTPMDEDSILVHYHDAFGRQMLTPAPSIEVVNWKRPRLNDYMGGVSKEMAQKAIADDIAFLDAHPTKRYRAQACEAVRS